MSVEARTIEIVVKSHVTCASSFELSIVQIEVSGNETELLCRERNANRNCVWGQAAEDNDCVLTEAPRGITRRGRPAHAFGEAGVFFVACFCACFGEREREREHRAVHNSVS